AVLFDEFHERSLDADLGLALARDSQQVLREDLRLLVMSATLDGAAVAKLLGDAPVIESHGRAFPVETRYLGRDDRRLEDQVARAVDRALAEEEGSVLVFLPGRGEIRRTETLLRERLKRPEVDIAPLYGALDARDQDRAIAPAPEGRRKVVLATSIAETSLTIEGVRVVVDCGFSRVPRYDPAGGLTRLETVRVSRAAADQRRGRAGRTDPGVCYRLWDEAEARALTPFGRPEILEADLSGFALDLARWGAKDAEGLAFLDPPPAAAFTEARGLLARLQALDADGALTAHGKALADLPLPPRLAHMVLRGAAGGQGLTAAKIAALLTERGLGGRDADLRHRLEAFDRDRSPRARDARALAERWAKVAKSPEKQPSLGEALLLAEAYPERIARARGKPGEFQLATGRGVHLEPTDALARETWLAVGELGGGAARDRILLAAPLEEAALRAAFADRLTTEDRLDADKGRAVRLLKLDRLVLEERRIEADPDLVRRARLDRVRREGFTLSEADEALRARAAFLGWDDLSDEVLTARLEEWIDADLRALLPWDRQKDLDAKAPARFTAPTGNTFAIDYAAEGGPRVDVRVQELFGLSEHPAVNGVPLTLALLSPAHRPIQMTRDLPGFWAGSWADVKREMKGRYPKHVWPDDPANAEPTARAKPRR
ncbi:MAG TPA: ATP-dependent helicase HrpB, partial [Caulobacteraceae bacterium]